MQPVRSEAVLRTLHRLSCWLLGLLLLVSGASKLLEIQALLTTLQNLWDMPASVDQTLAVLLIATEITCGGGLVLRRHVYRLGLLAAVLFCVFIALIATVSLDGSKLVCGCFGPFQVTLSTGSHIGLNVALFSMALFCGLYGHAVVPSWPRLVQPLSPSGILVIAMLISILASIGTLVIRLHGDPESRRHRVLAEAVPPPGKPARSVALLVVDLNDFHCPPCLEDFLSITRTLAIVDTVAVNIIVRRRSDSNLQEQRDRLAIWSRQVDLPYEPVLEERDLYERAGVTSTSIFLFDNSADMVFASPIPLPHDRRAILMNHLGLGRLPEPIT